MLRRTPLRVAILCSHRGPGLAHLVDDDPNRGRLYDLVLAVTSDPDCRELAVLDGARIPAAIHDIRRFYAGRGVPLRDLGAREEYDRGLARILRAAEPDLLVLCGYLYILTAPILHAFPERVVNVHDSDLTVRGPDGRPRYRGLRSTRDAIFAGEPETRSTVHLVTPDVDIGPLLVRSGPFPTHPLIHDARRWGATDVLKAYAYAQREWMMRAAWGRLLGRAIEMVALDRVGIRGDRAIVGNMFGPEELDPIEPGLAVLSGVGA